MKDDQLLRTLKDLGLTENESRVYLTALSLGPSTVLHIAKTAQVRRTTVYSVIEALKKKGLMHVEPRGFKQLYVAEHPNKLESMIDSKKHNLERVLPEFTSLYNLKGSESTIRYYEGLESVKTIYDTILEPMKPNDDYLVISNLEEFFAKDPDYFGGFLERRIKSRVKTRLITTRSKKSEHMKKYSKNMNHEVRFLPEHSELSVHIMITQQQFTIFNIKNPTTAVSIENPTTIKSQTEMFELLWASLPE